MIPRYTLLLKRECGVLKVYTHYFSEFCSEYCLLVLIQHYVLHKEVINLTINLLFLEQVIHISVYSDIFFLISPLKRIVGTQFKCLLSPRGTFNEDPKYVVIQKSTNFKF